ncbi:MAG TPA: hypothetical protein VEL47_03230, partial [Myxococcota bacterium]|nr:hypothetical protein [Myxococcota bacterium]
PKLSQKAIKFLLTNSARPLSCDQYCHGLENSLNETCRSLCCVDTLRSCGKLALDVGRAVTAANLATTLPPLLELDTHYTLFLRDEDLKKTVSVTNIGDENTKVVARTFDENIEVIPAEFYLAQKTSERHQQDVVISLRKEPYRRQTYKVDFVALRDGQAIDRTDLYVEYIPKK